MYICANVFHNAGDVLSVRNDIFRPTCPCCFDTSIGKRLDSLARWISLGHGTTSAKRILWRETGAWAVGSGAGAILLRTSFAMEMHRTFLTVGMGAS